MYKIGVVYFLALCITIRAAPGEVVAAGSAHISGTVPKVVSVGNGNAGVSFLGFKASAGLLTGGAAGGLHAEAETPFGHAAGAGLGGSYEGAGETSGALYAGAAAGGGVSAGAGISGHHETSGSFGSSYTGGGLHAEKVVEVETHKEIAAPSLVFQKHVEFSSAPVAHKEVEVVHEVQPQKTYVERTVIPNYEEKTIYVPSYVEKTVRVPTVIEKKVKVAAAPTIIEKTVAAPSDNVQYHSSVEAVVPPAPTTVVHKYKVRTRPFYRKHFFLGAGSGFGGNYGGAYNGGYGGSYIGDVGGGAGGGYGSTSSFTYRKTANPQLINDIFNIPISTLGAVGKLVGGIASRSSASGSFSASKSFGASFN